MLGLGAIFTVPFAMASITLFTEKFTRFFLTIFLALGFTRKSSYFVISILFERFNNEAIYFHDSYSSSHFHWLTGDV